MITCFIIKMNCQRRLQILDLHSIFTACTRGWDPQHSALSNTLYKRQASALPLCMFKMIAAWCSGDGTARTQRVHNVASDYTTRISAICNCFERCGNAVRPPIWRDRGLTQSFDKR